MPGACLPHPWVDFWLDGSLLRRVYPTSATQDQGLCFSYSACLRATLGDSTVPIGSRAYSFRGLALMSMLVMYFFLCYQFYTC